VWPTMDGRNPTNGFHPLYFVAMVAIERLIVNPYGIIKATVGLNLALNAAVVLVLLAPEAGRARTSFSWRLPYSPSRPAGCFTGSRAWRMACPLFSSCWQPCAGDTDSSLFDSRCGGLSPMERF